MPHILLVDDDADFVEIQKEILNRAGYDVSTAYNTEEALDVLKDEENFDLIILDLMMEHSDDGFRLAHRIKSQFDGDLPIMMLTGVRQEHNLGFDFDDPASRKWIEVDAYMEKPITPDMLLEKVRRLLADRA